MYGAEAVIMNLSRCLNAGLDRSLIAVFAHSSDSPPELYSVAMSHGVESYLIPCKGQIDSSVLEQIRDLVHQNQIDIVHAHGYKADIYAFLALRTTKTPIVSTCHTWHDVDLRGRLYGALDRYVLRKFDGVIAVSGEVMSRLIESGVDRGKIRYIRNGIDVHSFGQRRSQAVPNDRPLVVGLACRLAHEKGIDLFAEMAARILEKEPCTRFVVAGDGPQRTMLESLIAQLGIGASVEMLGRLDNMPEFYVSLDVLISSSRSEGLPMGLLEAMASGLPIVATAVGDVPSLVSNGETGILVLPNDVAALTEATLTLLRDPALCAQYGSSARTLVEKEFSANRMTQDNLEVYRAVSHRVITNAEAAAR